jgi:hypothetical protein
MHLSGHCVDEYVWHSNLKSATVNFRYGFYAGIVIEVARFSDPVKEQQGIAQGTNKQANGDE